jgi:hypothetical protein
VKRGQGTGGGWVALLKRETHSHNALGLGSDMGSLKRMGMGGGTYLNSRFIQAIQRKYLLYLNRFLFLLPLVLFRVVLS